MHNITESVDSISRDGLDCQYIKYKKKNNYKKLKRK